MHLLGTIWISESTIVTVWSLARYSAEDGRTVLWRRRKCEWRQQHPSPPSSSSSAATTTTGCSCRCSLPCCCRCRYFCRFSFTKMTKKPSACIYTQRYDCEVFITRRNCTKLFSTLYLAWKLFYRWQCLELSGTELTVGANLQAVVFDDWCKRSQQCRKTLLGIHAEHQSVAYGRCWDSLRSAFVLWVGTQCIATGKVVVGKKKTKCITMKLLKRTSQKYNLLTYIFIIYSIFLRKSVCPVSVKVL